MAENIDFTPVVEAFEENFASRGEIGAAVSVWLRGEEALHLEGGRVSKDPNAAAWTAETLVPVWSATKGPAALTLLATLCEAGLDLDTPVRAVWPELGAPVNFGELLSHQSGLCALDEIAPVLDHAAVRAALEKQEPAWTPGEAHGYHPRTFGFLVEECVRRLTGGATLGNVWRESFGGPLEADFWIGLPETEHARVARLYPGRVKQPSPGEAEFFQAMNTPGSLTRRSFSSPSGFHAVADLNTPAAWTAGLAGFGGVGSARGLAKVYAALANGGVLEGRRIVPEQVLSWLRRRLVNGPDRVLRLATAFSAGCMMDPLDGGGRKLRQHFGPSLDAFGHPGAGGSHAFADPANGLAFAYVMNQMEQGVLPNAKSLTVIEALYRALSPVA